MELSNRENWRSVKLNLNYEVSDIGRVKNVKTGRILKPSVLNSGYYYVNLSMKSKVNKHLVHRLVAGEFIENLNDRANVDHVDGVKTNNVVSNLWWATTSENAMNQKPHLNQTSKYKGVHFYNRDKKWIARIMINKKHLYLGGFDHETEAAQRYNEEAIKLFGGFVLINKIE